MGTMTTREEMSALYDQDFFEWTQRSGELLRHGCFEQADIDHLAEEIEDLGKRDQRGVDSRLRLVIMHLLKWKLQPERRYTRSGKSSWLSTIVEQRSSLQLIFKQSPSLKRFAKQDLPKAYPVAVKRDSLETGIPANQFPSTCPFTFEQIINDNFVPA